MRNHKSSSGDSYGNRNRYLVKANWLSGDWHFWENGKHSDKAKEYFRESIQRIQKEFDRTAKANLI